MDLVTVLCDVTTIITCRLLVARDESIQQYMLQCKISFSLDHSVIIHKLCNTTFADLRGSMA